MSEDSPRTNVTYVHDSEGRRVVPDIVADPPIIKPMKPKKEVTHEKP